MTDRQQSSFATKQTPIFQKNNQMVVSLHTTTNRLLRAHGGTIVLGYQNTRALCTVQVELLRARWGVVACARGLVELLRADMVQQSCCACARFSRVVARAHSLVELLRAQQVMVHHHKNTHTHKTHTHTINKKKS